MRIIILQDNMFFQVENINLKAVFLLIRASGFVHFFTGIRKMTCKM